MKRLKTFKQVRHDDNTSNDPNAIPLEEINGKKNSFLIYSFCFIFFIFPSHYLIYSIILLLFFPELLYILSVLFKCSVNMHKIFYRKTILR